MLASWIPYGWGWASLMTTWGHLGHYLGTTWGWLGDDLGTILAKLGKTLAYSGTLWHTLVFIFHFYFYHQDIVNCSKVRQCMYFPFWKLAVGTRQQHIFSFDRLLFKSLNTCITQLTCPHFRLAPLLTILSISNIRFHSWPFSSRPLQIIDITDIFCQDTIEITDRAPFLQRFQHIFSVFFAIQFDG